MKKSIDEKIRKGKLKDPDYIIHHWAEIQIARFSKMNKKRKSIKKGR